jgi:chromosome segregation protein
MQIVRLEIFGFKSFMERLVLPLQPGVTGVVGPNGCGKSNIVDAIRWVLGETKARTLRGGLLEDVIFNGTDKLRPLGLAEVTLTLRSSEKDFFADLISPTLEAELIADDVLGEELEQELALDDEAEDEGGEAPPVSLAEEGARPHLTVVSGALDEGGNGAKAASARAVSREERLAATATLLQRFAWLKSVSEVQVTRRLYRSGESEYFINRVACRLKDIKELLRAVGLGARTYTIVAQGEISRIVTAKPEERRLILEEAAGVLGFRDRIAAARRRLEETDVNLARINDIVREVSRQVGSLKRQAARARNRQELKDEIARLEQALFKSRFCDIREKLGQLESALAGSREREAQLTTHLHRQQSEEQAARSELMSVDLQGDKLRLRIDSIKEELSSRVQQRSRKLGRLGELRAMAAAAESEGGRLEERKAMLLERSRECEGQLEGLRREEESLRAQMSALDSGGPQQLAQLEEQLSRLRRQWAEKDAAARGIHDRLVSDRSSLALIEDQLIAASPLTQLENALAQEAGALGGALAEQAELLMDGMNVPEKYSRAAQAVLGEKALFLVCPDWRGAARSFVELVSGLDDERRRGLGLGVLQAGSRSSVRDAAVPFVRLIDEVQVKEDCTLAAELLLEKVYVAEGLAEALQYFEAEAGPQDVTIVTLAGEVVTRHSFQALRQEVGAIQLKAKAARLAESCAECERGEHEIGREMEAISGEIVLFEQRLKEAQLQDRAIQAEAREIGSKLGQARGRLQAADSQRRQIDEDLSKTTGQIAESARRLDEFGVEQGRVEAEIEAMRPEDETQLQEEAARLHEEYRALDEVRKQGRAALSACAEAVQQSRAELDDVRGQVSGLELEKQKLELERESLKQRVLGEYGAEACERAAQVSLEEQRLSAEERAQYSEDVAKLKARILREGDVDPDSIQRLEEEQTRLDDLSRQRDDLEAAAVTLKRSIERLTETSLRRFLATFEAVKENFTKLTPRLFGGGRGSIELDNPASPLESGLEIIARPPGKKLKSLELLSGGEKALCAAALIFSMFLERPSPLCVLDEVDAPLDDANLMRFLSMVKEMSARTQFLLITHNKQSMGVCDNLIGVTMEEPGASKVLSVSLQEAYSQVA